MTKVTSFPEQSQAGADYRQEIAEVIRDPARQLIGNLISPTILKFTGEYAQVKGLEC